MKMFQTQREKTIWKIGLFVVLFMVAQLLSAFFGLGLLKFCSYLHLTNGLSSTTLRLIELIIRYGLALLILVMVNHYFIRQKVFLESNYSLQFQFWPLFWSIILVGTYLGTSDFSGLNYSVINTNSFMFAIGSALLEEYTFRGVVFPLTMKVTKGSNFRKLMYGVAVSSLLFGCVHFSNISYQSFEGTCFQVAGVIAFGIVMAVIYARTESLILPILAHFASDLNVDFASNAISSGGFITSWWWIFVQFIISIIVVAVFLRPSIAKKLKV